MTSILGISGSLRHGSFNTALLRAAQELSAAKITIAGIREIPLYDGDLEARGVPDAVETLKRQVHGADGLLISTPEYNNSVPGVLKNTIDWLSRPSPEIKSVFRDKPVAVMGASPGGWGTLLCQNAWLTVFRSLGARQWAGGRLLVSGASSVFDEAGRMTDPELRTRLEHFVSGFADFCQASRTG